MKCYLCLQEKIPKKNSLVCLSCFSAAQTYVFSSCVRCGQSCCSGHCQTLPFFISVASLYEYNSFFSDIVNLAKNQGSSLGKDLFYELFFEPFCQYLERFILRLQDLDAIFLAPLSRHRVFQGYWHTSDFFESAFEAIQKNLPSEKKPLLVLSHNPCRVLPQSRLPWEIRKKAKQEAHGLIFHKADILKQIEKKENPKILILDDVLTTGKTIESFLNSLEAQTKILGQYYAITLFRSRVKNAG